MAWSLACAATISRWTPASTSFASARVRPKSAMSTRPSGRLISTTSAHDPSPSAPISTSLKTQATYPPSVRERARKYPTAVAPPISRQSLWPDQDERQRVLWPSFIRLSDEYFRSLQDHAGECSEIGGGGRGDMTGRRFQTANDPHPPAAIAA